jgi:phosphate transport system protein
MIVSLHSDREYEAELKELREAFRELGEEVGSALKVALGSLTGSHLPNGKHQKDPASSLARLSQLIDRLCVRILALRQPTASDLRFVVVALKANVLLGRISSLSRGLELRHKRNLKVGSGIIDLANRLQAAFDLALDALIDENAATAKRMHTAVRNLAALERKLFGKLKGEASHEAARVLDTIADIAEAAEVLADLVPFLLGGKSPIPRKNTW